jgi:hypothetical protein
VASYAIASVYWTIKRREMASIRKPAAAAAAATRRCSVLVVHGGGAAAGAPTQQQERETSSNTTSTNTTSNTTTTPAGAAGHAARRRSSMGIPLQMAKRIRSSISFGSSSAAAGGAGSSVPSVLSDTESAITNATKLAVEQAEAAKKKKEVEDVMAAIESFPSARKQNVENNNAFGSRAVYTQSLLYTLTFFATYTFATINRIVQQLTGETYFIIIALHVTFIPLQGFFNVVVYRRDVYIRLKQRHPHMTQGELLRRTWRWTFLGPPAKECSSSSKRLRKGSVEETAAVPPDDSTDDDCHHISTKSPRLVVVTSSVGQQQDTEERETRIGGGGFPPNNKNNEEGSLAPETPDSTTSSSSKGATMMATGSILVSGTTNMLSNGAKNMFSSGRNIMMAPMSSSNLCVPVLDDCFDDGGPPAAAASAVDMDNVMADLMISYADFPNMLAEDSIMVTMEATPPQAFPTSTTSTSMRTRQDSFHQVTGNSTGGGGEMPPQSFPTRRTSSTYYY